MKLNANTAPPPKGFTDEYDETIWTYGFLFVWSKFYEQWCRSATMVWLQWSGYVLASRSLMRIQSKTPDTRFSPAWRSSSRPDPIPLTEETNDEDSTDD